MKKQIQTYSINTCSRLSFYTPLMWLLPKKLLHCLQNLPNSKFCSILHVVILPNSKYMLYSFFPYPGWLALGRTMMEWRATTLKITIRVLQERQEKNYWRRRTELAIFMAWTTCFLGHCRHGHCCRWCAVDTRGRRRTYIIHSSRSGIDY